MKQVVTIQQTERAMLGLTIGDSKPDMLSALRNSALSLRCQLISNAGYAIVLRKYRRMPLPCRAMLELELRQAIRQDGTEKLAWGLMEKHIQTLYVIDRLWFRGYITLDYGNSLESQRTWRDRMAQLIPGMGYKLISWALFIYDPLGCKLLTIDCIHCDRLGIDQSKLSKSKAGAKYYCKIEDMVIAETQALYPGKLSTIVAAMLWLNHRGLGLTSHDGINCRKAEQASWLPIIEDKKRIVK